MIELLSKESHKPSKDQQAIIDAYFKDGRLCVDAGAGTGKTTTLVNILAQIVLNNLDKNPTANPFERGLAVTFGVEAARHIKSELRRRLKDHLVEGSLAPPGSTPMDRQEFWRFFESESNIFTIDALFISLLREISPFIGLPPSFDIPNEIDRDEMIKSVIQTIRSDKQVDAKWDRLEAIYSANLSPFRQQYDFGSLVNTVQQKMREFCWSPIEVRSKLIEGLDSTIHCGKAPPKSPDDIKEIIQSLGGKAAQLQSSDPTQALAYARAIYDLNKSLLGDFADVLEVFDCEYEKRTRETGALTHIDVAYYVWRYASNAANATWQASLRQRFDDVLIDEFQDTSFVQYSVLVKFVNSSPRNRIVLIGDVKQAVYQWRSADPGIFVRLIESSKPGGSPLIDGLSHFALSTNFRSHPQLLYFFNGLFSKLFTNPARGAIDIPIPYNLLQPQEEIEFEKGAKVHVITNTSSSAQSFVTEECRELVKIVAGVLGPKGLHVRDRKTAKLRPAQPGDIGIIFRRNRYVQNYADGLRRAGYQVAVLTDSSLFAEPEISLVVDLFDWLANPDSRDPLIRVLRSPLVASSDEVLRYLASKNFLLNQALAVWPTSLPEHERKRLEELMSLRRDLRWDREGRKSDLLERIIAFSALDSVVMAGEDGLQAQANLWQLVEYVSNMEEEELIGYSRFVGILKELRGRATSNRERDFGRAILALPESGQSITMMTVHGAKGLEYPILIMADSCAYFNLSGPATQFIADRHKGLLLKPQPADEYLPFRVIPSPGDSPIPWVATGEEEGLLWVSKRRDPNTGQLLRNSGIDAELRSEISEQWRLLYVAATRARDHLIFSASAKITWEPWNCWMPFLRDNVGFVQGIQGEAPRNIGLNESRQQVPILIGFDDLERPSLEESKSPPLLDWNSVGYTKAERKIPAFLPRSITPSNFIELLECPRRYQFSTLWRDAGIRVDPSQSGSRPPPGYDPDDWGTFVHQLMENRRFEIDVDDDEAVSEMLELHIAEQQRSNLAHELMRALKNFESSEVGQLLKQSAKERKEISREEHFAQIIEISGYSPIELSGIIDLRFETASREWALVDFKSELQPPAGSYKERMHRMQLNAYAWVVEKSYGLHINRAVVAYVHPTYSQDSFVPNPSLFEANVKQAITTLELDKDPTKGLVARPKSGPDQVCASCPYSLKVGGPCEYGA